MKRASSSAAALVLTLLLPAATAAAADAPTSCIACHGDDDLFEGGKAMVEGFMAGVHAEVGLSCHDCHGGNPSAELADDLDGAMDESYAANPYRGAPSRQEIPAFCGSCHSDAEYMRRFDPAARVDQESEYRTSRHGIQLARGDLKVAVCTDCHELHSVRRISSAESRVYPTRVAETCNGCHGDAALMAGRTGPAGLPIPIDAYSRWRTSVHAAALLDREDLSAPTCNDCHGNHGAAPPGIESIGYVCGQCHGREAELFRASAKHDAFVEHNEFLADAGTDGCAACHDSPQAELTSFHGFVECATCHENHGIVRPTLAMFSGLPDAPCEFCHDAAADSELATIEPIASRESYAAALAASYAEAEAAGVDESERFDWLIDRALSLPEHRLGERGDDEVPLRPEFERLFSKFRLGKSYYEYKDPNGEGTIRARVTRCDDCHDAAGDAESGGLPFVSKMRELTVLAGHAERTLLAARRGGVETHEVASHVDSVVDAEIDLQVLVHTFDASAGGEFIKAHAEGMQHARAALQSGAAALDELQYRRKGLALALVVIVAVLIGLALKIRTLRES